MTEDKVDYLEVDDPICFPVVHIFTDFNITDTDDPLLMAFMLSLNGVSLNLTFVFTGSEGISPSESLESWKRKFLPNLFDKKNPDTVTNHTTLPEYMKWDSVKCDYALQIAPGNDYDGDNLTVEEKYVFAGDFITPEGSRASFNRTGSDKILEKFYSLGKLVDISSSHMAQMRFEKELLSMFDGPFLEYYFKAKSDYLIGYYKHVYSLFAGYVLVGFLKGEEREYDSVDDFNFKIVQEF